MASLVKNKGKVGMPSFYGGASTTVKSKAEGVKSKLPLFALLILAGVAIVFVLRNRSSGSSTQTGAALSLYPSGEGDLSNIWNMTQAINALNGQVHIGNGSPGGGVSNPITTDPSQSIYMPPGSPGNTSPNTYYPVNSGGYDQGQGDYSLTPSLPGTTTPKDAVSANLSSQMQSAIQSQAAFEASYGGGANPNVAGPAGYGPGANLAYLAQLKQVVDTGHYLPNASGPGLSILPGGPTLNGVPIGQAAPEGTTAGYTMLIAQLKSQYHYSDADIAAAQAALKQNLSSGISLDPGTSAAVAAENAAKKAAGG